MFLHFCRTLGLLVCLLCGFTGKVRAAKPLTDQICIIGAGLAGLTAAGDLVDKGYLNVMIYEAKNQIGGRIMTQQLPDGNVAELGAEFIAKGSKLETFITSTLGLTIPKVVPEKPYVYTSKGCNIDKPATVPTDFSGLENQLASDAATAGPTQTNVQAVYLAMFNAYKAKKTTADPQMLSWYNAMFENVKKMLQCEIGTSNLIATSSQQIKAAATTKNPYRADSERLDQKGFKAVLDALMDRIGTIQDNVKLNSPVTEVNRGANGKVTIKYGNGQTALCDEVIDTRPMGVLKQDKSYKPPLDPDQVAAISNIGFGSFHKIVLYYKKPFWNKDGTKFILIKTDSPNCNFKDVPNNPVASIFELTRNPNSPNILTALVAGNDADLVAYAPDNIVIQNITSLTRQYFNDPTIPPPDNMYRYNWVADPFARGTSSFITPVFCAASATKCTAFDNLNKKASILIGGKPADAIFLAGEGVSSDAFGMLEGAFLTGQAAASAIYT